MVCHCVAVPAPVFLALQRSMAAAESAERDPAVNFVSVDESGVGLLSAEVTKLQLIHAWCRIRLPPFFLPLVGHVPFNVNFNTPSVTCGCLGTDSRVPSRC